MTMVLGTLALVSLAISFIAYGCLSRKLQVRPEPRDVLPPISILKPLKGLDDGLYENLAAIARQDYPAFEVLFCAEDADDPALAVAEQVQRDFPGVPIRVLSGALDDGLNPKVRILRRLLPACRHEWILISDSNVRPGPDYLRAQVGTQQATGAALVSTLLAGVGERSIGARLENLQMNGWVAASIAFCDAGEHACVIGKSMLMNQRALRDVGGLEGVKDILAEDYILGSRFGERGHVVALSSYVLEVVSGARDLGTFFNRHVRWGQMRRRIAPVFYLGETLVNPFPFFLALFCVGAPEFRWLAAVGMALRWSLDVRAYLALTPGGSKTSLALLPLKDALMPFVWAVGAVSTRVAWRGNRMRVGPGSRLSPLHQPGLEEAIPERA
ncbi:MAG TPA: glycosyltransferase [Polyangiaceae bacterium]|nr:glycosyltransferase [Polyangiaceae bacterium]